MGDNSMGKHVIYIFWGCTCVHHSWFLKADMFEEGHISDILLHYPFSLRFICSDKATNISKNQPILVLTDYVL